MDSSCMESTSVARSGYRVLMFLTRSRPEPRPSEISTITRLGDEASIAAIASSCVPASPQTRSSGCCWMSVVSDSRTRGWSSTIRMRVGARSGMRQSRVGYETGDAGAGALLGLNIEMAAHQARAIPHDAKAHAFGIVARQAKTHAVVDHFEDFAPVGGFKTDQ